MSSTSVAATHERTPVPNQPGQLPLAANLVDVARLVTAYYTLHPDPRNASQRVAFGTSGHRGSAFQAAFNEDHIAAITQAICEYRASERTAGPLFLAKDTHALSEPAFATALEVLAANAVDVMLDSELSYTPTPALSHAILTHNRNPKLHRADGIVITPSHNPPEDGGFKYNPPSGGPADTAATKWIEDRANQILASGLSAVKRVPYSKALSASTTHRHDYLSSYVEDLGSVIDFDVLRGTRLKLAVDPLGGAGVYYWPRIAEQYDLPLEVLHPDVDATFRFMTCDWDGRIRMDCSSPYAMASMIANKDRYDVAFAADTDHDRHGIVTRTSGLLNPNHYLSVCIEYLFTHRPEWSEGVGIGKTMVSSSIIDRVARGLGRRPMLEVPVGFKWFVEGLLDGTLGFVGEESAGATFLRRNGQVWTTDKDGLVPGLLAAEMTARTGKDPGELYAALTARYGDPVYERIDAAATKEQKAKLAKLSPAQVTAKHLAGEPITSILTEAPGNHAPIGGLKVTTENGWFAARPSGTEDVYKIYAESFLGKDHLKQIQTEAQRLVTAAIS